MISEIIPWKIFVEELKLLKIMLTKISKNVNFTIDQKVLLWDTTHANKGKQQKFQILCTGPFKISVVVGPNPYHVKDLNESMTASSLTPLIAHT